MRRPGGRGRRLVQAAAWAAILVAAAPAAAAGIEVEVRPRGDAPPPAGAVVDLRPVGGAPAAEPRRIPVEVPGRFRLDLAPGEIWEARAEAPGWWSEQVLLAFGAAASRIDLWPGVPVTARLVPPPNQPLPHEVTLRFGPSPASRPEVPEATVTCPVDEAGIRCLVPASSALDLRLRARGHVSHFFWSRPAPAGTTLDLGRLALRPGGSVVGWVETEGAPLSGECTLHLAPAVAGPGDDARRERLAQTAVPTDRGFFAFEGLAAGDYVLTASQPGLAPVTVQPIEVLENAETELHDPVRLAPPVRLEIVLEPPRDPFGEEWSIELARETLPGFREPVPAGREAAAGRWIAEGLAAGRYAIRVRDSRGATFAAEDVEVDAATGPHHVRLDVVPVEGEVRLGDEPLWSAVRFSDRTGAVRIEMITEEDGTFFGFLPREGTWAVQVVSEDPDVDRRFPKVEVRRISPAAPARVDLELPGTHLRGEVVDEAGRPVEGARVRLAPVPLVDRPVNGRSDEEGRFELVGLEPGLYEADATAEREGERLTSAAQGLRLDEAVAPEIQLVVRPRRSIAGRVVGPDGAGRAAARVFATPLVGPSASGLETEEALTDATGRFEIDLPHYATGAALEVMAPGLAHHQRVISPLPREPVVLTPEAVGGTLVLQLPEEPIDWLDWSRPIPLVVHDGGPPLAANGLVLWARLNGVPEQPPDRLVIPRMPAGRYLLCLPPTRAVHLDTVARLPPGACEEGELWPLGEVTLRVPGGS